MNNVLDRSPVVTRTRIPSVISDLLLTAPVDVAEAARRLGLEIFESSLGEGISGAIMRDTSTESGFVIYVDDSESYVRQRFTAAHEIGHFVLHKDRIGAGIEDNFMLRSSGMSNFMEAEANRFAADLLMPFPLIEKMVAKGHRTVDDLARVLGVSTVAMSIRLGHPT